MELRLQDLTTEQKIGMILTATFSHGEEDIDYTLQLIREHKLGSAWINHFNPRRDELIRRIREAADYPILICSDAEAGHGDYKIPQAISLACTGSDPALAYSFGKVTAIQLHALGYNVVPNPVLDMTGNHNCPCGANTRVYGNDKDTVAKLGIAIGRGMHDGGIMVMAKHYPGEGDMGVDTHMQEALLEETEEELLEYRLYPYLKMIEAGVLDAAMTGHVRLPNIDPDYPASLSRKVLDILRRKGFDGFYMTDALSMMGIVLKYGKYECNGLAAAAGNECVLSWGISNREAYEALLDAYRRGVITDELLDVSVTRILAAQHQAVLFEKPKCTEITEEDKENFRRLNEDCIRRVASEGVTPAIDKNGRHLFVVLIDNDYDPNAKEDAPIGNFDWYLPKKMKAKIQATYPNSDVHFLRYFPSASESSALFNKQIGYDDVIYVTYWQTCAYLGRECLSSRVIGVMEALQTTNRIAAVVHFGNPYLMEEIPHVDRVLFGCCSLQCTLHAFDVLCGDAEALGVEHYKVNLK